MKNRIDTSRQRTPWDNNKDTTNVQDFIKTTYKSAYKYKHKKLSETNENEILNSVKITSCPYCGSTAFKKKGFTKNKIQRYFCKKCESEFTPTTGTIFENHKISITEWIEFLLNLFNYGSTSLISKVNKNAINTSSYWLQKTFLLLKNYQKNIVLKDRIYIDEMFYKVIKKEIETKDGKQLRGLSHNQYCIGLGYDGENIIAFVEGLGKTSINKTMDTFSSHIKFGSKIIHDDEKAHKKLVKELNLQDESYNSLWLKTQKDDMNPLRPINHQCDLIRQFLNTHSGFDRTNLQDYLNLYCFMNSRHKKKLEKVEELLELALNTRLTLKYREAFQSKEKLGKKTTPDGLCK